MDEVCAAPQVSTAALPSGYQAMPETSGWKPVGRRLLSVKLGWTVRSGEPSPGWSAAFSHSLVPGATTRAPPPSTENTEFGTVSKVVWPGRRHCSCSRAPPVTWK